MFCLDQFKHITEKINELQLDTTRIILQPNKLMSSDQLKSEIIRHDQHCQNFENENQQLQSKLSTLDKQSELLKQKILPLQLAPPVPGISIPPNYKWTQNGYRVAGGSNSGNDRFHLHHPYGFCVDDDQVLYIADSTNNRILKWRCRAMAGELIAGGRGKGDGPDQLNCPTDVIVDETRSNLLICDYQNRRVVRWRLGYNTCGETIISNIDCHGLAMDKEGYLYVTDYKKNEVRKYKIGESHGILVAGGNGDGNRLDQLNGPLYVFVGRDNSVYVSDEKNDRVIKWKTGSKEGIVVAGGRNRGNGLEQLSQPGKIFVNPWNTVFVADWGNDRIMSWPHKAILGHVVVGKSSIERYCSQLRHPISLTFDQHDNLYVANQSDHEIRKFDIDRN
ncbi:unnamed protein product [Adineta steineri]|uniref:Uncharacterized protein n=1 Tax=Adineta steineri TaxID=433720 RepID=A0A815ZWH8_9BILA|nr:unnamed protein product [Adineta steineri]CAF1590466.1 unnamed protein product [Adineta steineri]